ncbi:fimbrillin family protein [Bacteroides cellulosilyticus]|uniref:fimbrillin family protein n=1 Tax=Bacteroides cellulosilyticus TaxID=246787 RepID=UPI001CCA1072|nr:fimbrillin family protein [Bacteroides cellulosilyticus]
MKIHNHTLPKAIRRHSIRRWLATAATLTAMMTATLATLTGCSADNDPETAIGGDGTSVTFGATIAAREGHDNGEARNNANATAPASRAIPDGTFEEGDQILVHMDGKRKAFVYSTAQGFVHAPNYPGTNVDPTPPVWQDGEAEKSLLAYGPTACISSAGDGALLYEVYVSAAQNDDREYRHSDYVYTAQTLYRSKPALSFRHGMARVVLRLRSGGSLTDEDVAGASVLLGDKNLFTIADIDPQNGTLTAHVPVPGDGRLGPQTITPHRCADTPTGYVVAYEALMPPQDVSGKAFIKVRLSDGTELGHMAASGSMLKGGHEYVYNVTVEANRLAVTVTGSDVPWQDGVLTTKIDGKEFRLIRTAEDLARFARDVNGDGTTPSKLTKLNALQTADIDLQDLARSADPDLQKLAEDWVPIGSKVGVYAPTYEGIYCGNGYTISGLRIKSNHGTGNNGLFGSITGSGALLTGIHLRDVRITGTTGSYTGALAGYVRGGTVTLCSAEGTIEATLPGGSGAFLGGLVGMSDGCSINRCRTKVNIKADVTLKGDGWAYAGGIVGDNREASTLFACQSEGEVSLTGAGTSTDTQALYAGGIAGRNSYANDLNASYIRACMATGNVSVTYTGTDAVNAYAGGLVGYNDDRGSLQYSYARGTATAATGSKAKGYAGAIIGGYNNNSNTNRCFGAGAGGAGTSGLEAASGSIAYNESPGEREIRNVIVLNTQFYISTILYDASATPAYGISVSSRSIDLNWLWLATDPTWPALDMEYGGL